MHHMDDMHDVHDMHDMTITSTITCHAHTPITFGCELIVNHVPRAQGMGTASYLGLAVAVAQSDDVCGMRYTCMRVCMYAACNARCVW